MRGRMVDGEMQYLERGEQIVSFQAGDPYSGIISLDEFLDRACAAFNEEN